MEIKVLMPCLAFLDLPEIFMGELGMVDGWDAELSRTGPMSLGGVCICVWGGEHSA